MDELFDFSGMTPHQVGRWSENRVRSVLEYLTDEGYLRGYRKTRPMSKADKRGVDFYLFTDGRRIPLQVKSSNFAREHHLHYEFPTFVPCVVGRWKWAKLVDQVLQIVYRYGGQAHGDTTG